MMRYYFLCLAMLVHASSALALSCAPIPLSHHSVFFEGVIENVSIDKPLRSIIQHTDCTIVYTVKIDKVWHGAAVGDRVKIHQDNWGCYGKESSQNLVGKSKSFALSKQIKEGEYRLGICGEVFFNPYDTSGELTKEFKAHLDMLKAKEAD